MTTPKKHLFRYIRQDRKTSLIVAKSKKEALKYFSQFYNITINDVVQASDKEFKKLLNK